MQERNPFREIFGSKPILAGVYSRFPEDKMIEEIQLLNDQGVEGAYLENIGQSIEDTIRVYNVLDKISSRTDLSIKIGVNILPAENGFQYMTAISLAKKFGLTFLIQDMIAGTYQINGNPVEFQDTGYFDNISQRGNAKQENIIIIGGVDPHYARRISGESIDKFLKIAGERSDAMQIKVKEISQGIFENGVPEDRIKKYSKIITKPLIIASKITSENIGIYTQIPQVCGFIIGSGLRDEKKELYVPNIKAIQNEIKRMT